MLLIKIGCVVKLLTEKIFLFFKWEIIYFPGIINNVNYFFTTVALYEDGVINCWEKVEFHNIKNVIEKGWLCCEVPNGKNISIFQVGDYTIKSAKWKYNKETYYKTIIDNLKELNPKIESINKITREVSKEDYKKEMLVTSNPFKMEYKKNFYQWFDGDNTFIFYNLGDKITREVSKEDYKKEMLVTSNPFKMEYKKNFYQWFDGDNTFIFYNLGGQLYLTTLTAYEDKTFEIGLLEEKYFSLEEIKEMFEKNILTTEVKDRFFIKDFAEIEIEKINYFVEKSQKLKEIEDMMKKVCEEETTLELCREAYFNYLEDPCDYTKNELRKAYEAVPEHERIYLGDMDSKDCDYQRILYSDEKREV